MPRCAGAAPAPVAAHANDRDRRADGARSRAFGVRRKRGRASRRRARAVAAVSDRASGRLSRHRATRPRTGSGGAGDRRRIRLSRPPGWAGSCIARSRSCSCATAAAARRACAPRQLSERSHDRRDRARADDGDRATARGPDLDARRRSRSAIGAPAVDGDRIASSPTTTGRRTSSAVGCSARRSRCASLRGPRIRRPARRRVRPEAPTFAGSTGRKDYADGRARTARPSVR